MRVVVSKIATFPSEWTPESVRLAPVTAILPPKRGKMAVQHFLDRDSVGLHLPSFIIRAVVRHGHFYTFYLFLQTISPCSFIAATAQRFCTE